MPEEQTTVTTLAYAWGAGEDGQLGIGDVAPTAQLRLISRLTSTSAESQVVSLVGGSRNSLALTQAGGVFVWGWNQRSTLGHPPDPPSTTESVPCQVHALKGEKVVQAAIGGWHCLALTTTGTVFSWGGNEYGQCAARVADQLHAYKLSARDISVPFPCIPQLKVKQVAAGGTHSVVLTEAGEVWTWGQPWPPAETKQQWVPVRVPGLSSIRSVVAGAFHNIVLRSDGAVLCWGNNEYGQLGTGDTQPSSAAIELRELRDKEVVDIAAGGWHSMAITREGQVWAWGRGEHGRLGFGDDKTIKAVPHLVELLGEEMIMQASCGGTHSAVITVDGRLFTFGRVGDGRLGPIAKDTTGYPVRVPLPGDADAVFASGEDPSVFPRQAAHRDRQSRLRKEGNEESEGEREREGRCKWRAAAIACGGRHNLVLLCHEDDLEIVSARLPWSKARAVQVEEAVLAYNAGAFL